MVNGNNVMKNGSNVMKNGSKKMGMTGWMREKMYKMRKYRASTIVEMAYLMPVVLMVWMLVIFALFYYHDKNILSGAAYETAVVGSELAHEEEEVQEGRVIQYFQGRIKGKMLFFRGASVEVQSSDDRIQIKASASAKGLRVSVERSAAVTEPEEEIRKKKAIMERIGGDAE